MGDISGVEKLLLEALGLPFLSFVLNAKPEQITARLSEGKQLGADGETALGELMKFLDVLSQVKSDDPFSLEFLLANFGTHQAKFDSSWAVACHAQLGGSLAMPETGDPVQRALLPLARDVYPLFLLPEAPSSRRFAGMQHPNLGGSLHNHPGRSDFEKAFMADAQLAGMFPDDDTTSGRHGSMYRSTGIGGGTQLWMLPELLIRSGWLAASRKTDVPTLNEFAVGVLAVVDFLRDALGGKKLEVTALVGVAGVRLRPGESLNLPWGRLRPVTPLDLPFVPPGLSGQLTTTTSDGESIAIDYAGDLVMEMQVPYAISLTSHAVMTDWPLDLVSQIPVEEKIETLRLGLLLASKDAQPARVVATWRVFLDPLAQYQGASSWNDPRRGPSLMPAELTKQEARDWLEWTTRVDEHRVKNIDVAIRRTLMAAADRPDPGDALVDAAIAWENLVGTSQGEPTLRVSAALAWLLGKDGPERTAIRQRVAKLYELRSKIVHGARFLTPREAVENHHKALEVTLDALRVIFRDRPELLKDCKDSAERSLRLILDDTPSTDPS